MKVFRISVAAIVFAAFGILAYTQTRPAATPATPANRPAAAPGSIAVIDSAAFGSEKAGITRVMNAMKTLETKVLRARAYVRVSHVGKSRQRALLSDAMQLDEARRVGDV